MHLLIDIGNTNTTMALLDKGVITRRFFIRSSREKISQIALRRLLGRSTLKNIRYVLIVSVVPSFLKFLKEKIKKIFPSAEVCIVGKDIKVPIKNSYHRAHEVGQDRLVAAYAAKCLLKPPLVVIDFGSAVTMDFVNKKGEYEGGLIFPGLRLALTSLVKDTALLPSIVLRDVKGFIGRDTKGSMNNGIVLGYAALCDGLIEKFRAKYGKSVKVITTGGDAFLIAGHTRFVENIYPDLIFRGLRTMVGTG